MNIGDLRRRVRLMQFVEQRDEFGAVKLEWANVGFIWASIEPISGTENFGNQHVSAEVTNKITMRYHPTINVMHRIGYQDKLYEIKAVMDEDTLHKATVLLCKEVIDGNVLSETEKSKSNA